MEVKSYTPLDFLILIHAVGVQDTYQNLDTILRIFITIPVTTEMAEQSFSKMKIIKNYLRSTMEEQRLSDLVILSIEKDVAEDTDFDAVILEFATAKSRKIDLF